MRIIYKAAPKKTGTRHNNNAGNLSPALLRVGNHKNHLPKTQL